MCEMVNNIFDIRDSLLVCETQSIKYVSFTVTDVKFMTGKDGELESVLKNSKSWPGKNAVVQSGNSLLFNCKIFQI